MSVETRKEDEYLSNIQTAISTWVIFHLIDFVIYGQFFSLKKDQVFLDFKIRCDIGMMAKMFELDVRSCLNILNILEENFLWWIFIVIFEYIKIVYKVL